MAGSSQELTQLDISREEFDKLVAEVIRYLLFKTHQNASCPIKRDELTQIVTKNYGRRTLPTLVINEAKEKLASIFGLEMRELQRSRPSSNKISASQGTLDSKSYVLVSQLPADVYHKYVEDPNTVHLEGLAFAVIGIVQIAGGTILEETLWHHLRKLGLHENDENHPVFGSINQALQRLVQQRYLQRDKISGPEGVYELAERALEAPLSESIREFVSKIVKKDASMVKDE